MNKTYQIINMIPSRLSNFHPLKCMANSRNITVDNKDNVEYARPKIKMQEKKTTFSNLVH